MKAPVATRPPFTDPVLASLFERRVVLVHGELTTERASEVAAALLTLDALGDEHVELRLQSPAGSWEAAGVLVDVIDVLGVPTHTVALGVVGGGAVAVFAAGTLRLMAPHAQLHLRPPDARASGRPADLTRAVAAQTDLQAEFLRLIAERTRRAVADVEAQWAAGGFLDALSAIAHGYADALCV